MPSISFRLVPLATSISALIYRTCRFVSRLRMLLHSNPIAQARVLRMSQITQALRFMIARQIAHSSITRIHDALVGVMPSALS